MGDGGFFNFDDDRGQAFDVGTLVRNGQRLLRPRVELAGSTAGSGLVGVFGELLAQPLTPIPDMQISFPYSVNDVYVKTTVANGGAVAQSNSKAVLTTSAAVNGSAIVESVGAARYTPGQGQAVRFTALFTTGVANSQQEVGIGDAADGFFFGYQGATFGVFRRQNSVDTFVARTAFNGDKLDGTGPSGLTLDPTKGNVYQIRYQWLGFGAIFFYVQIPATGAFQLVHTISYSNANTDPSIFNPSLPIHVRAFNTGNASNLTLQVASLGAYCEGPLNMSGGRFSTSNRKTAITTELAILSIRNNATVFGGKTNRARVHLDSLGQQLSGAADSQVRLVLNATLGGAPAFADLDTNRSVVAIDTAGTTVTGGRAIKILPSSAAGASGQSEILSDLQIRLNPGDVLTFAASSFAGAIAANLAPAWREEL